MGDLWQRFQDFHKLLQETPPCCSSLDAYVSVMLALLLALTLWDAARCNIKNLTDNIAEWMLSAVYRVNGIQAISPPKSVEKLNAISSKFASRLKALTSACVVLSFICAIIAIYELLTSQTWEWGAWNLYLLIPIFVYLFFCFIFIVVRIVHTFFFLVMENVRNYFLRIQRESLQCMIVETIKNSIKNSGKSDSDADE